MRQFSIHFPESRFLVTFCLRLQVLVWRQRCPARVIVICSTYLALWLCGNPRWEYVVAISLCGVNLARKQVSLVFSLNKVLWIQPLICT